MLKTIGAIVVIGLVVGVFGYFRGWFTVDRTDVPGASRVTFGLDTDKVKRDADASRAAIDQGMATFKRKIEELKSRSKTAADADKAALDRKIAEFEAKRDDLTRQLDAIGDATDAAALEKKREIRRQLDEATIALDKALTERGAR